MWPLIVDIASPHVRTAGALVAALSTSLGQPVEIELSLRNVLVLVDEPGRSSAQRLSDLAYALRASVVRDGRALRIERSALDQRAVAAIRRSILRQRAAKGLENFDRLLKRSAALGGEEAQMQAAQQAIQRVVVEINQARMADHDYTPPGDLVFPGLLRPAGRLTLDLMRRLGPERLADLTPSGVRFFSDHPNVIERPLPGCDDLLAEYGRRQPSSPTPAKLILRVDERGATLQAFDAQGHLCARSWLDYANRVVAYGSDVPPPGGAGAVWRTLDQRARGMASFLSPTPEQTLASLERSDEVLATLALPSLPPVPEPFLYPERDDPLDFAVREGVLALPREPGNPGLVAVLSDGTLGLANALVRDGKIDVAAFDRDLLRGGTWLDPTFERLAHGGVTVLRPRDPLASEMALVDRAALGTVVRRVITDGQLSLHNWTAAQFALYSARDSEVKQRYFGAIVNLGLRCPPSLLGNDPLMLALVGAALAADRPAFDADLPPFREMLRDAVAQGWLAFQPGSGASDLAFAPSTLLASGALERIRIAVASSVTPVIDQVSDKVGFVGDEIGHAVRFPLYPPLPSPRSEARTKALFESQYLKRSYRLGHRTDLVTEIRLEGSTAIRVALKDSALERTGVTFDGLPAAFQDDILAEVRKELKREGVPIPEFLSANRVGGS